MNLLTADDLDLLAHHRHEPCASIFVPLERGGPEKRQNRIRLKNALRDLEKRLREFGLGAAQVREFLAPAGAFLERLHYWKQDSDGLALFMSPKMFRYYRLPSRFQDLAVVADRFHVKPLLPLLAGDGRFYVLALSQSQVRLLQCTHHSLREVELTGVPTSLAEALQYDVAEKQLQFHSGAPGRGRQGGAVFYAQADASDRTVHRRNVTGFLHQVDKGVHGLLADERAPLVLAGVEEIRAIYAEVNNHPHLMAEGIDGNPDRLKAEQVQARGWRIVRPRFEAARREAVAAYERFAGTKRASSDLDRVLEAAADGQVEILLADLERHRWGTFDPEKGFVYLHYRQEGGDEDLLDWAAVETLVHGGTVFALETAQMPDGSPVSAVFRY